MKRSNLLSTATLFLLGMLLAGVAHAERRVALVVGNGAYAHATKLPNPVNDARDIRERLSRLNFDVVEALDVTVDGFDAAVTEFERKASGAELALFYFAGHGLQFNGINYLLPIDVKIENDSALRRRAVVAQDIIDKMERAAKVNLVFLDACRNNALLRELERSLPEQTRNAASARGLARMDPRGANTLIAFATAPNEVAADGTARNSPFTSALLRHIETPNISVQDMLTSVAGDVLQETNQRQKPEVLSRLSRRVVLLGKAVPVVVPPVAVAPSPSREREASVGWEAVKDSCDRNQIAVFRQRYGETFFGDLARHREGLIATGGACAVVAKPEPPKAPEPPKTVETPKPSDPKDDAALVRALQVELKRVGCYDGNVDGKWGDGSGAALKSYGQHAKSGPIALGQPALEIMRAAKGRICPPQCAENEQLVGGNCRRIETPAARPVNRTPATAVTSDPSLERAKACANYNRCVAQQPGPYSQLTGQIMSNCGTRPASC